MLKKSVFVFFIILVLPSFLLYFLLKTITRSEKTFQGFSQFFSIFPGTIGEYIRKAFYKLALQRCSSDCCISFGVIFSHSTAVISDGVYIGSNCTLGDIVLEKDVLLGSNVDIMNGTQQHIIKSIDIPIREQGGRFPKVVIGEDTWIGNSSVIMADIGHKCVIGAGSVVVKPIEAYSIAVGNPARVIKKRV